MQVCIYEYLLRYNDVKSSNGSLTILTKQGEYQNLTQVMPVINPYIYEKHHYRKLLAYAVIIVSNK